MFINKNLHAIIQFIAFSPPQWMNVSGGAVPLKFCIQVRSRSNNWGGYFLAKNIIRWWYFTCKDPENIICDDVLHVNMFHYFKTPYITCTFFYKIYLQWIYCTLVLSHIVSRIFCQCPPQDECIVHRHYKSLAPLWEDLHKGFNFNHGVISDESIVDEGALATPTPL